MKHFLLALTFLPFIGLSQNDSTQVILEIDDIEPPQYYKKVYSKEEEKALEKYGRKWSEEPVALYRELHMAVNSNDQVAYHILKVNHALVKQHKIKRVSFFYGKNSSRMIAWVLFDSHANETDRFVKYKYVPYQGDYSEFCLYKHSDMPYRPSTNRMYRKENNHPKGLLQEFIWDDMPLNPVIIKYEFFD